MPAYAEVAGREVRTGKRKPRRDEHTLQLERYLETGVFGGLPPQPRKLEQLVLLDPLIPGGWGMMGNDDHGDCTDAGIGHAIQVWTTSGEEYYQPGSQPFSPSTQDVLAAYWRQGSADDGRVMLDVLNDIRANGLAGHRIGAYAEISRSAKGAHRMVRAAINLFGLCYIGVALPETAQRQTEWTVVPNAGAAGEPWSWGGHAIILVDYDQRGPTCITWGKPVRMSWGFFDKYCDEAYAIISPDFLYGKTQVTPRGVRLDRLQADLERIAA